MIDWYSLSRNPNAIEILKENQDKINWHKLSENKNAIELLKENQDKINWVLLCFNDSDKIDWTYFVEYMENFNINFDINKLFK